MEKAAKTLIAQDIEITGSIKGNDDIEFHGKLNGDLTSKGHAVIGESAEIKGNLAGASVAGHGTITGNISAGDRIELKPSARISGDIKSKRLTVEDGVSFVGKAEVNPGGGPAPASGDAKAKDRAPAGGSTGGEKEEPAPKK